MTGYNQYQSFIYNQTYRLNNRVYYQDYCKAYNEKNKERLKEYRKSYYANKNKMKQKGSVIDFKEETTTIRFD